MTTDQPRPVFDPSVLDLHTGGDRELLLEVVNLFLEDCPARVAAIRAAVHDADPIRIRATAHALKGSAAYLGAAFVVGAAADLEAMGFEGRIAETVAGLDRLETAVDQFIPVLRLFSNSTA